MAKTLGFKRNIPIRYDVDVLVVGGGPAGCAAAIAAAREGCKVLLVEGEIALGGMGTAGLIPAFMQFSDGINFLAGGIGEEIWTKLKAAGGTGPDNEFSIRAEVLKRVYDGILLDAGVELVLQCNMIAVETEDDTVQYAILFGKSGIFAAKARVFIDGTGDGDLAAWAGAPYEKGDADGHMMAGTLCSLWADIDWGQVQKPDDRRLHEAFEQGVFTHEDRHLPGMWRVGNRLGGGNIGHTFDVDGTDERSITVAAIDGRRRMQEYEQYYKEYLSGYENMELVATGSLLGIRESRRIMGDYVLCLEDFQRRAVFEDEIGRYSYPVDIHASQPELDKYLEYARDFINLRYGKGESYGIPYRTLTPQGLRNVLVAGRCISSDRYIQSSIRVMPGCYITGQAAGIAAALALRHADDVRGFPVLMLQRRLRRIGGYLPNLSDDID